MGEFAAQPLPHQLIDGDLFTSMLDTNGPGVVCGEEGPERISVPAVRIVLASGGGDGDENAEQCALAAPRRPQNVGVGKPLEDAHDESLGLAGWFHAARDDCTCLDRHLT